jgi:apolipoprotein N-acyltransferase
MEPWRIVRVPVVFQPDSDPQQQGRRRRVAMGKINWRRLLIGGLVAGAVMNLLSFAEWKLLMGPLLSDAMQAAGQTLQESATMGLVVTVTFFVVGILVVWLYAAIRPRFGPGPGTAAMAGVAVGILLGMLVAWGMSSQLIPATVWATDAVATLVIVVIGTLIGARLYREQAA